MENYFNLIKLSIVNINRCNFPFSFKFFRWLIKLFSYKQMPHKIIIIIIIVARGTGNLGGRISKALLKKEVEFWFWLEQLFWKPILKILHAIATYRDFFFRLKLHFYFVIRWSMNVFNEIGIDDKLSVHAKEFLFFQKFLKLV